MQKKAFPYLLSIVVNHAQNLKHCPHFMQKLRPVMFEGIIRVGGRLEKAKIDFDSKHPIILPMSLHFTELVIRQYHAFVGHLGTTTLEQKCSSAIGLSRVALQFVVRLLNVCSARNEMTW